MDVRLISLRRVATLFAAACTALGFAACGGSGSTSALTALVADCGSPPPGPPPQLWLVYPEPGATSVPTTVGILVFASIGASSVSSVTDSDPTTTLTI